MRSKMLKLAIVLILFVLSLMLSGCKSQSDGAKKSAGATAAPSLTCKDYADRLQSAAEYGEMTDANEKYLEKYLLISASDLEDFAFRRDNDGASPEMILILKVKSGADQAKIKKAVQEYLEERTLQYRDYQPEQLFKLEQAKVLENGPFIALAVCKDEAKAISALGGNWK